MVLKIKKLAKEQLDGELPQTATTELGKIQFAQAAAPMRRLSIRPQLGLKVSCAPYKKEMKCNRVIELAVPPSTPAAMQKAEINHHLGSCYITPKKVPDKIEEQPTVSMTKPKAEAIQVCTSYPSAVSPIPKLLPLTESSSFHDTRKFLLPVCWTMQSILELIGAFWITMKEKEAEQECPSPGHGF